MAVKVVLLMLEFMATVVFLVGQFTEAQDLAL